MICGLLPAHFDFARLVIRRSTSWIGLESVSDQPERSAQTQKEVWVRKNCFRSPRCAMTPRQGCCGAMFFFFFFPISGISMIVGVDVLAVLHWKPVVWLDSTGPWTSLGAWEIWEFLFVRLNRIIRNMI